MSDLNMQLDLFSRKEKLTCQWCKREDPEVEFVHEMQKALCPACLYSEKEKLEDDREHQMEIDAVAQMKNNLNATIENNYQSDKKFIESRLDERKYPEILDVGPLGVKWKGENVRDLTTAFAENYTPQFGFTCAECGGSGINSQPVNHHENCEREINENL